MITPEHVEYVRKQLAAGASRADIIRVLLSHGWKSTDVDEAFAGATGNAAQPAVPGQSAPASPAAQSAPRPAAAPILPPKWSHERLRPFLGIAAVLVLVAGGVYAYAQKIGPFARLPYNESNLVSGLLLSAANIKSSSYSLTGSLSVVPREAGAEPFVAKPYSEAELEQYERDAERAEDAREILYALAYGPGKYPATLAELARTARPNDVSLTDPLGKPYAYTLTAGGNDFALAVTFETTNAIAEIQKLSANYDPPYAIAGQTVTFTSDSSSYLFVPSEPSKPFFEELGENLRELPSDMAFSFSVAATSDWQEARSDWKFNLDVTGDFGDLSFKVNADALKKDKIYYVRVNNIPSIVGEYFSSMKGKWIEIDVEKAAESDSAYGNDFQEFAEFLPEFEAEYKENREKLLEAAKVIARAADDTRLFSFKTPPRSERVDGRTLYRYDLRLNKESVLQFYKQVNEKAENNELLEEMEFFNDPAMIEYLESEEFYATLDYLDKNLQWTLWVDQDGNLGKAVYALRIVPPDTAQQLEDKQINFTIELTQADVNKPVLIEAPVEVTPIQELIEDLNKNLELD